MIKTMKKHHTTWLGLAAALLMAGCATTPQAVNDEPIDNWALNGKIAVVYPSLNCDRDNCPKQSDQGKITWQQQLQHYHIVLSDPFGRVVMTLDGDDTTLQAAAPKQQTIHTTPSEFVTLLTQKRSKQAMFADLQPQDLRYWVTGRAVPNQPKTDKGGNAFEQKGFTITGKQWRETPLGYLPSLVTVVRDQLTLRLVIKQWNETPAQ